MTIPEIQSVMRQATAEINRLREENHLFREALESAPSVIPAPENVTVWLANYCNWHTGPRAKALGGDK